MLAGSSACGKDRGPTLQGRMLVENLRQRDESIAAEGSVLEGRELASALHLAGPSVPELEGVLAQSLPGLKAPPPWC